MGGLEIRLQTPMMPRMRDPRNLRPARFLVVLFGLAATLLGTVAAAQAATVTVAAGDSLSGIAARNGTTVSALARANGITNPNVIVVGRRLTLPGTGTAVSAPSTPASGSGSGSTRGSYRVRSGDTLGAIAARHGVSVSALSAANGITNPNRIVVGRVLTLPGSGTGTLPRTSTRNVTYTSPSTGSGDIAALLEQHAARYGVPASLARAIAWQESRWNQNARSHVGAVGVMQIMPATARWFGPAVMGRTVNPHNLNDNIETGVAYLGWLLRNAGNTRTAIGGYYQGLSSLKQRGPYDDTTAYINSVMRYMGRV